MSQRNYKIILPSSVTGISILCGIWAIFLCVGGVEGGKVGLACWLIIFAAMVDGVDGKVARLTRSSSEFGIQLDSIADVLTFGAAVTVILYTRIYMHFVEANPLFYLFPIAFLLCSAFRLARFNLTATTGEKNHYNGLPMPSAAGALVSLMLTFDWLTAHGFHLPDTVALRISVFYTLLVCVLMLSPFRFPKTYSFLLGDIKKRFFKSVVNAALFVLLFVYPSLAFFSVLLFYIVYSLTLELLGPRKAKDQDTANIQFR